MPLLQELVTKFTSDMTQMDKGFQEATRSAEDYSGKVEQANDAASKSAETAGNRIDTSLNSVMDKAVDGAFRWAAANSKLAIGLGVLAAVGAGAYWIKTQIDDYHDAMKAADDYTDALRRQAAQIRETAAARSKFGREAGAANAWAKEQEAQKAMRQYEGFSDDEIRRQMADLGKRAEAQAKLVDRYKKDANFWRTSPEQMEELKSGKALNPFGGTSKADLAKQAEEHEKQFVALQTQAGDLKEVLRIRAYRRANLESDQAKEAEKAAAAQAKLMARAAEAAQKLDAQEAARIKKDADRAAVMRRKEAEQADREAARRKEASAREAQRAAEAARDSQVQQAANQFYIASELAADEYDRQRLEIKGRHLETLRQIEKAGGDESSVRLAILRSSNALRDVDAKQAQEVQERREREAELAAKEAKAEADAVAKQQAQEAREAEKVAKATIEAKRRELERQTKELEDARRDAYSKVGFTGIDEIGRNAVVSGMRAQFVSQQDLLRGSALTGMGAAARENDRLITSNQQQVALLEKLLRAFESAWRATPQGI